MGCQWIVWMSLSLCFPQWGGDGTVFHKGAGARWQSNPEFSEAHGRSWLPVEGPCRVSESHGPHRGPSLHKTCRYPPKLCDILYSLAKLTVLMPHLQHFTHHWPNWIVSCILQYKSTIEMSFMELKPRTLKPRISCSNLGVHNSRPVYAVFFNQFLWLNFLNSCTPKRGRKAFCTIMLLLLGRCWRCKMKFNWRQNWKPNILTLQ